MKLTNSQVCDEICRIVGSVAYAKILKRFPGRTIKIPKNCRTLKRDIRREIAMFNTTTSGIARKLKRSYSVIWQMRRYYKL
jgi:hypothetical protein